MTKAAERTPTSTIDAPNASAPGSAIGDANGMEPEPVNVNGMEPQPWGGAKA